MALTTRPMSAMVPDWEQPEDAQFTWMQDRMHFPYPITRMEQDLLIISTVHGHNRAFEHYDMPIRRQARRFWAHYYGATVPLHLPEEELQAMAARSQQKVQRDIAQIDALWEHEWLPAIQQHLNHLQSFDLTGASDADLIEHMEDALVRLGDIWLLHFVIGTPAYMSMSLFEEFYRELFSDESAFRPYQLLQGLDNRTVASGNALWRLSRKVANSSMLRDIFFLYPTNEVMTQLDTFPEGQDFLKALRAFLEEFGKRGETWGFTYPAWIEDPTPVIKMIRDYVDNPGHNPERDQRLLAEERERLIAESRAALTHYPEAVRAQFDQLLKAAQTGMIISEDHGYWIDFMAMYEFRRVFLEVGRRLAMAGVLAEADDIFHLSLDETRDTFRYLPRLDRRGLVAERKAEIELYRSTALPLVVGAPPEDMSEEDPGSRLMKKFFGGPPRVSDDPDVLFGAAGSPGVVRGPARLILDIADAARLQPGDIMVTTTTAPPWTPLFGTAAAVVTDTGGVLSHCAVVAREYRIPAVVGTGVATTMIQDGQMLEVDGERGVVRIIRG